ADRNRSHWSTSKTPSYTKSVSWQHHHHFLKIRERNNVSDVLVEITMFDDPDWPFSESILVITTASPEEVQSWFVEEIAPDECWEGWSEDTEHGWVEVPVGMHPVTCWWD
ncbi:hypothetical protein, partial [Escherichia coli]|uniref:hypothetical protein n=2 Tax=Escherichia coli TaxID=562 RepID=UPI00226E4AE8